MQVSFLNSNITQGSVHLAQILFYSMAWFHFGCRWILRLIVLIYLSIDARIEYNTIRNEKSLAHPLWLHASLLFCHNQLNVYKLSNWEPFWRILSNWRGAVVATGVTNKFSFNWSARILWGTTMQPASISQNCIRLRESCSIGGRTWPVNNWFIVTNRLQGANWRNDLCGWWFMMLLPIEVCGVWAIVMGLESSIDKE